MARSDLDTGARPKVLLIGGDGGLSGVPRHLGHVVGACAAQARFVVLSEPDRGGYGFLRGSGMKHVALRGLSTRAGILRLPLTLRRLSALLRHERPDLVWAHARLGVIVLHLLVLLGVIGRLRRADGGAVRLAITYHGGPFDPGHRRWLAAVMLRFERFALARGPVRRLVFLSAAAEGAFRQQVGPAICARHVTAILPNSTDIAPFTPAARTEGTRRILVAGRVARQKNLVRALRIFAALPGSYRLVLCGEGTDHYRFRRRARAILGAHALRRIDFAGPVEDLRPWLAGADCFLMTSLYEGLPIAALEAFRAGLPLALPDIQGCHPLLASHPHAAALTADPRGRGVPAEDALRIVALTEAYRCNRPARTAEIRIAWERHHGFAAWCRAMRGLLGELLPEPPGPGVPHLSGQAGTGRAPMARVLPFPGPSHRPGAGEPRADR